MSNDVERLIKIQNVINKSVYHLFVETDLEESYKWVLFLNNPNLENYLKKHGGFERF